MATCVTVDSMSGALTAVSTPLDQCTSYVLMDASTYTDLPTMVDVFTMPTAQDLGDMWMIGFTLPLIVYLSSWAYQSVINFATKDEV